MSSLLYRLERHVLPFVQKPARYIGSEIGIERKPLSPEDLRLALIYPDLYEVGMSNLGLKVLHAVASRLGGVTVERSFVPWPDAESLLREHRIPLYSLESFTPLREFDLLGLTLQSELTYTNVLTVLDLAGIPLRSADRGESDPLVCAGGPCTVNPEPLAPFFDFFVLGDGETALCRITGTLIELRKSKASRKQRLEALGRIEGVFVPGEQPPWPGGAQVIVQRVAGLERQPAPDGLPLPLLELAQHHFSVEIMRGCTCGCRFCQAGMYYRPVRVRSVAAIVETVRNGIRRGGWDAVTLLSLSSADYPAVEELVEILQPELESNGVRLSFPSLRVDRSTLRLLGRLDGGNRSGLTFAVEAGSPRLRGVIGKKVEEENLLELAGEAFRAGWTMVKLYFMLGLPSETEEDIDQIARLVDRVARLGREIPGKHNVNVTLSPFVPKPGTPFQWEPQTGLQQLQAGMSRVRQLVRSRNVTLKMHDPRLAIIEGVLARGDRRVAGLVQAAWERGARLDGWRECFDFALWEQAFETAGLEAEAYLRGREESEPLPWHYVRLPVTEAFLSSQKLQAALGENVADCAEGPCLNCGAEKPAVCRELRLPESLEGEIPSAALPLTRTALTAGPESPVMRLWRVRYAKRGFLRYLGHLDLVRAIEFMLRRSGQAVRYTEGFNPRMKLHFSPPLPLAVESEAEYFDFECTATDQTALRETLERTFRDFTGFQIMALKALPPESRLPQLAADISCCLYRISLDREVLPGERSWLDYIGGCCAERLAQGALFIRLDKKGRRKEVSLRPALEGLEIDDKEPAISVILDVQGENAVRADSFLEWLLDLDRGRSSLCRIEKKESFVRRGELRATPLEF